MEDKERSLGDVSPNASSLKLSIIVPSRDEKYWPEQMDTWGSIPDTEVILVRTGEGSERNAPKEIRVLDRPVLSTRAQAMNEGAKQSSADLLLFLHADSSLNERAISALSSAPKNKLSVFLKSYIPSSPYLNLQAFFMNLILRFFGRMILGTNGLVISRSHFEAVGGFPDVPILEDALIVKKLRKEVHINVLPGRIHVSSRRYTKASPIRHGLRCIQVYVLFLCGKSLEELRKQYLPK